MKVGQGQHDPNSAFYRTPGVRPVTSGPVHGIAPNCFIDLKLDAPNVLIYSGSGCLNAHGHAQIHAVARLSKELQIRVCNMLIIGGHCPIRRSLRPRVCRKPRVRRRKLSFAFLLHNTHEWISTVEWNVLLKELKSFLAAVAPQHNPLCNK